MRLFSLYGFSEKMVCLNNATDIEAPSAFPADEDKASSKPEHEEILEKENCLEDLTAHSIRNVNKARALILLVATLYGSNFTLVKMMGENNSLSVGMTSTIRFGLAALATSPWLFANFNQIRKDLSTSSEAAAMVAGFEVGLWNSVAYTTQAVGLETTLASKSAFFCSLAVVVVPLLDFFFKGHMLKLNQVVGLLLAVVGVGVLEVGDLDLATGSFLSHGDCISLIQAFAFGLGLWRMEAAMQKYPNHALRASAAQQSAVFFGSLIFAVFSRDSRVDISQLQDVLTDPVSLAPLLWTGLITTALSKYMETVAMKTLSAAETTLFLSTEPVSGSLFAAVLIGERLGINAMIGSGLILMSCITSSLGFDKLQPCPRKYQQTAVNEQDDGSPVHADA